MNSSMALAECEAALLPPPWTAVLHEWVTIVDHKKIGIMYFLMAVVFLVIGGVEAMVMRL
jgi:heme/copper-type cytochrome/quinol oxidase subunit 1